MTELSLKHISQMIEIFLYDDSQLPALINSISVTVTEMFRDPQVFKILNEKVIPVLKTYPKVKIWHAGCATGEEVYSLAILLSEAGIYNRCEIIATDINPKSLDIARKGMYPISNAKLFTSNYQQVSGHTSFSDYYHAKYEKIKMNDELSRNVTFVEHNLAKSRAFDSMHLILCRNVLIYFDKDLQNRALNLFASSLVRRGFLCIGTKESLNFTSVSEEFEPVSKVERIFRKL
jgi:chemotaxis protein methyltransferase CheR